MLVRAAPVLTPFRRPDPSSTSDSQSIQITIADDDHTSTSSAVPAVRPAHGHVLLSPKAQTPVAAVAAGDVQASFIPKAELLGAPSPVALLRV